MEYAELVAELAAERAKSMRLADELAYVNANATRLADQLADERVKSMRLSTELEMVRADARLAQRCRKASIADAVAAAKVAADLKECVAARAAVFAMFADRGAEEPTVK
jgi:hypothetical protein